MDVLKNKKFKEIEHTADHALFVWGDNIEELFGSALASYYYLLEITRKYEFTLKKYIHLNEIDMESLLVKFINEFIFFADVGEIYPEIEIEITGYSLHCHAKGIKVSENFNKIKALTFNQLKIEKNNSNEFESTLVYDV